MSAARQALFKLIFSVKDLSGILIVVSGIVARLILVYCLANRSPYQWTKQPNCYDNAIAERENGIIKSEYLPDSECKYYDQSVKTVKQGLYLYNFERPHWFIKIAKTS